MASDVVWYRPRRIATCRLTVCCGSPKLSASSFTDKPGDRAMATKASTCGKFKAVCHGVSASDTEASLLRSRFEKSPLILIFRYIPNIEYIPESRLTQVVDAVIRPSFQSKRRLMLCKPTRALRSGSPTSGASWVRQVERAALSKRVPRHNGFCSTTSKPNAAKYPQDSWFTSSTPRCP